MLFRSKPRVEYQIVEVEKPLSIPASDPEVASAISALQTHPGFTYLMAKLKLQRSLLESKLKKTRHADIRDVDFLQTGIFWVNWLEDQVNAEVTHLKRTAPRPASQIEREQFEKALASIEAVG